MFTTDAMCHWEASRLPIYYSRFICKQDYGCTCDLFSSKSSNIPSLKFNSKSSWKSTLRRLEDDISFEMAYFQGRAVSLIRCCWKNSYFPTTVNSCFCSFRTCLFSQHMVWPGHRTPTRPRTRTSPGPTAPAAGSSVTLWVPEHSIQKRLGERESNLRGE